MAWNRPSEEKKVEVEKRGGQRNVHLKGLVAGAIVVLGAGIAAWLLWPDAKRPLSTSISTSSSLIKEVKPAAAPKPVEVAAPTNTVRRKKSNANAKTYIDERGIRRYEGGARYFDGLPRRKPVRVAEPPTFRHWAENRISELIEAEPGDMIFITPRFDKRFLDSYRACLKDKIEILDTDTDEVRESKQAMIEVKEQLAKMDEKEALQMIEDTYSELQRLAQYKRDVKKMAMDVLKEGKALTDKDCEDIIGAANLMLKEKGVAPISKSILIKQNIKRHNTKE